MEPDGARATTRSWPLLGLTGALVLGCVAVHGIAGAASRPGGIALGVPGPLAIAAVGLGVLALALLARSLSVLAIGVGLLPLFAHLSGLSLPGLRAFSGPPVLALVLGVVVLVLWRRPPALAGRLFFPVILLLYLAVAARLQSQVGPEGDGPHYLLVADSLLHDHDLDLTRDFAEQRYRAFYDGPLEPHRRMRGRHGKEYSIHPVGLSVLILPAYAAAGYPGVSFFLAALAALLAREIRELVRVWMGTPRLADGSAWVIALSPLLLHHVGVIFTEIPAALLTALVLHHGRDIRQASLARALGLGTAIACLPWLHVRYIIPAVLLLAFLLLGRPPVRRALALVLPSLLSAIGIALFHWILYGFLDPRRVYGHDPVLAIANIPTGLAGLFFDQEFGLLPYAPLFVLALPGLLRLARGRWRLTVVGAALCLAVIGVAAAFPFWRGGFNPEARFLVPLLPVLALGVAAALRSGPRIGAALLIGWSLWVGAVGCIQPRLVHRDRDGTAPLFRAASGAEEWTTLLPSFVRPPSEWAYDRAYDDRSALLIVWAVGLAVALLGPRLHRATSVQLALGLGALITVAAAAEIVTTGRSDGRDAVRLLGRRAYALPAAIPVSDAVWEASTLRWGGDYSIYRLADGVSLGSRLPLPAGRYALTVKVDGPPPARPPQLSVRPEGRPEARRDQELMLSSGLLEAVFEVLPGERAVRLVMRGGETFWVDTIRLAPLPEPPPRLVR
jgi:hypothetical protein